MIAAQIIAWLSIFLVLFSYLLFPLVLAMLARGKEKKLKSTAAQEDTQHSKNDQLIDDDLFPEDGLLPRISILMAAFNEESVLEEKLTSIYQSNYPQDKLEVLVGSDASTDRTNEILNTWGKEKGLRATLFESRQGKPGIINQLAKKADGEVLVITDADVMLEADTLRKMCGCFNDPSIGLVDTLMMNRTDIKLGITRQEKFYSGREVRIKYLESLVWKSMMGPFGGCYGIRRELYSPVPDFYLVDDFFINMKVLEQGKGSISCPGAIVSEKVSGDAKEEYRRKRRISTGNFQNLAHFKKLLLSRSPGVAFCFFSHKVLRWIAPLLLLTALAGFSVAAIKEPYCLVAAALLALALLTPVIDYILRKIHLQILPLRFVSHFIMMNLALLAGFIQYLRGVKSNVWQPTSRKPDQAS